MPEHEQSEFLLFEENPPQAEPKPAPKPVTEAALNAGMTRTFLGWSAPLVDLAVAHLATDWDPRGEPTPLDLSDLLVIVPTQNAGRRLRERLATHAAECADAATLPPRVATPEFLTSPALLEPLDRPVASHAQTLIALIDLLLKIDLEHYRRLFPVDPVERNFSWALKTASDLLRMRSLLGEAGLSVDDAAKQLAEAEKEPERWRDISRIDRTLNRLLDETGLIDRSAAQRRSAREGLLPPEIRRIAIIGEPDAMPLAIEALRHHARSLPVEILIYAPPGTEQAFDREGRPVIPAWIDREIELPDPLTTLHPAAHPSHQAERTIDLLAGYETPPVGTLAIGVPDPEVIAPLERAIEARAWGVFDPAGTPLSTHGLFHLLRVLQQLITGRSFAAFAELLRIPGVHCAIDAPLTPLLKQFDRIDSDHLPDTIDDALTIADRRSEKQPEPLKALKWIDDWLRRFKGEPFDHVLMDFLGSLYGDRELRSHLPADATIETIADQINRALDDLDGPVTQAAKRTLNAADRLELLLHLLQDQVYYPERAPSDIDLQGWLELLWEDAPHLVLTGMNDGRVPESIVGHPFLPDSAREILGLRHNDSRLARDAYLLTAMIEMRRADGRIDFVFGRTSESGDPLRPSRLLFACSDGELPDRTLLLFDAPVPNSEIAPWELAFQLKPESLPADAKIRKKLSATQFRAYLACPFRFFLRYGLQMESHEAAQSEMNPRAFGSHLHSVLERFAEDETLRESRDPQEIREFFHDHLDRIIHGIYGSRLTVPLLIQLESAKQRLGWWAELEAEQRELGWEILEAEYDFSRNDESPLIFEIAGHRVSGSVDRIERHRESGVIRLLDFKTGARKQVEEAHIAHIKRTENVEDFPEWALTATHDGKPAHWIDLQLPLYQLAMQEIYPSTTIEVGYVTLARAKNEVALDTWPDLTAEKLNEAKRCAEGVIHAIQTEQFWPPAEKVVFDDFKDLFFGDVEAAVDAEALLPE